MKANIIVTTDFSDNSKKALRPAKALADHLGGKLTIVHVMDELNMVPSSPMGTDSPQAILLQKELIDQEAARKEERLEELSDDFFNGKADYKLLRGSFVNSLNAIIEELKVGFVVMATNGENDIADKIFGTNSLRAMRNLECPVIAFPKDADDFYHNEFSFALGSFYKDASFEKHFVELAKSYRANATFIHSEEEGYELYRKEEEKLQESLSDFNYRNLKLVMKNSEEPFEGIQEYLNETPCDLIALVSHTNNIFEKIFHDSVVNKALNRLEIPILCYNENNKF